jgi:predicted nucleic acid-binding protein
VAQAGHADYIVSGDKHLLDLATFDAMPVVRATAFLELF